jgi:hypothetical protein
MRKVLHRYLMWTPKKATEEEGTRGEGEEAGLRPLYRCGPTAVSTSGRTYAVGLQRSVNHQLKRGWPPTALGFGGRCLSSGSSYRRWQRWLAGTYRRLPQR